MPKTGDRGAEQSWTHTSGTEMRVDWFNVSEGWAEVFKQVERCKEALVGAANFVAKVESENFHFEGHEDATIQILTSSRPHQAD